MRPGVLTAGGEVTVLSGAAIEPQGGLSDVTISLLASRSGT